MPAAASTSLSSELSLRAATSSAVRVTAGRSDTRSANAFSRRVVSGSLAAFLRDELKLELSREKTLITHARTQAAAFLGYEITVQHSRDRPNVNGGIRLRVPQAAIKSQSAPRTLRTASPSAGPS